MEFSIKDAFRAAVELQSNGNNTVMYDDFDNPNIMVLVPKFTYHSIGIAVDGWHNMFNLGNGREASEVWVGKYPAQIGDGNVPVSISRDRGELPITNLTFVNARESCAAKGRGWHLMTNPEWSGVWLWAKANGSLPLIERNGLQMNLVPLSDRSHDGTHEGIFVYGSVFEWVDGIELRKNNMIYWWTDEDDGDPNNNFIDRPFMNSHYEFDSAATDKTFPPNHIWRPNNIIDGDTNFRDGSGLNKVVDTDFYGGTRPANDVIADRLRVMYSGLVSVDCGHREEYTMSHFSRNLTDTPYKMVRGGSWTDINEGKSTPMTYSLSLLPDDNKCRYVCRPVYIQY